MGKEIRMKMEMGMTDGRKKRERYIVQQLPDVVWATANVVHDAQHHTELRTRDSKGRAANTKLHKYGAVCGVDADDAAAAAACGVAGRQGRG